MGQSCPGLYFLKLHKYKPEAQVLKLHKYKPDAQASEHLPGKAGSLACAAGWYRKGNDFNFPHHHPRDAVSFSINCS